LRRGIGLTSIAVRPCTCRFSKSAGNTILGSVRNSKNLQRGWEGTVVTQQHHRCGMLGKRWPRLRLTRSRMHRRIMKARRYHRRLQALPRRHPQPLHLNQQNRDREASTPDLTTTKQVCKYSDLNIASSYANRTGVRAVYCLIMPTSQTLDVLNRVQSPRLQD
jgi:hypothetical protein